jgi:hypothetical protein
MYKLLKWMKINGHFHVPAVLSLAGWLDLRAHTVSVVRPEKSLHLPAVEAQATISSFFTVVAATSHCLQNVDLRLGSFKQCSCVSFFTC